MTTDLATTMNLDQLLAHMQDSEDDPEADHSAWIAAGLPMTQGVPDWTSLPIFGGEEPHNTNGVWSWDAERLIVGTCADDIKIISRDEF